MSAFLFAGMLVLVSIGVHYEGLWLVSRLIRRLALHRLGVVLAIVGALLAHMLEILVFAIGIGFMSQLGLGGLAPPAEGFGDFFYFSAVTYSSLGYGDVIAVGPLRQVAGIEALTGLVMIAWTASFSFLQMAHLWGEG